MITSSFDLVDWTLRASAILGAVFLIGMVTRKLPAAMRHTIWLVAIVGALVLPLLAGLLPQWRILPGGTAEVIQMPIQPVEIATGGPAKAVEPGATSAVMNEPSPLSAALGFSWYKLWALGAGLVFGLYVLGTYRLARLARRGSEADGEGRLSCVLKEVAAVTSAPVPRLLIAPGSDALAPMVIGTLRPKLIVPASAEAWSEERLRVMFAHELAHIERRDLWSRWLGALLCAAQWFNPLAWIAARRAEAESECACDNLAVRNASVDAASYAQHPMRSICWLSPGKFRSPR